MKPVLRFLVCLSLVCATMAAVADPPTASTDIVPRENWSYDALMHLAAEGLVPDMAAQRFQGDWLFTREEMAGIVASVLESRPATIGEAEDALLARLAAEFRAELLMIGAEDRLAEIEPFASRLTVATAIWLEPRVVHDDGDFELTGAYNITGLATTGKHTTAGISISNRRRLFGSDSFSYLDKAFIRGKTKSVEWEIGKDYLWWGPGYSGGLILSDNSPSFPMVLMSKDLSLGKRIGHVKMTQFVGRFHDRSKTAWLLGRRWEKRFSERLHLGINETGKMTKTPNPLALVLPSLYLYEHIFLDDIDKEYNAFISGDITYKFSPKFEIYGDLLIDEMNAPSWLRHGPNMHRPTAIAVLAGLHWRDLTGDDTTRLRTEFISVSKVTYTASREDYPELDYTQGGLLMGSPVGPNSRAVFVRLDKRFPDHWTGALEALMRWPTNEVATDIGDTHRISLLVARDLAPRTSLTFRYDHLRLPESESRIQIGASYAF